MYITIRAISYNDKVLYYGTYNVANWGKAYDALKFDYPELIRDHTVYHIDFCDESGANSENC